VIHREALRVLDAARRPNVTPEEAVPDRTEVHAPLVKKTFGDKIIKYVTNVGLPLDTPGWSRNEAPPYDGIAEFWT
jgi:EthD domain-containing protein